MQSNHSDSQLPAALQSFSLPVFAALAEAEALHAGMLCPACGKGILDYDGLLNLACMVCGFQSAGGGGCT
jgi:uncharacterized protein (DUF983 family)